MAAGAGAAGVNVLDDSLQPKNTPDYMMPAWYSCLRVTASTPGFLEAFRKDTGCQWRASNSPIEMMIDEQSGYSDEVAKRFIRWFNENVWGDPLSQDMENDNNG